MADALSRPGVRLVFGSFEATRGVAEAGDFLYVDPPYAPLSRTAHFTSYTAARFSSEDQARLQQLVVDIARRGCHVLLSNSSAAEIAALYDNNREARAAGLQTFRVAARRAINSNAARRCAARRGTVDEYLITNIELQDCGIAERQEGRIKGKAR